MNSLLTKPQTFIKKNLDEKTNKKLNRILLGEIPLNIISLEETLQYIEDIITEDKKYNQIVTLNSLMYNFTFKDIELKECIKNASLVIPDSIGICIACFILSGYKLKRIPGIDLMLYLCEKAEKNKWKIFLLGTKPEVIPETALNLKKFFPNLNIAGFHHGFFDKKEEEEIVKEIENTKPNILFVGLDISRQEKWIYRNLKKLQVNIAMGVGGSFDVISGKLNRAPILFRKAGLEWFYRFLQEPSRIRRIKDLPVFIWRIFLLKLKSLKITHKEYI